MLNAVGPAEAPLPPLNLAGDFGGGSLFLVVGILSALLERSRSGCGQIVDAAMVDGASLLVQLLLDLKAQGLWQYGRSANLLDGGAPFYRTYACADGLFMAVGSLEPQFYALMLTGLELDERDLPAQYDRSGWPVLAETFARRFRTRTRAEWTAVFDGTDACVTPVLSFDEAVSEPHVAARGSMRLVNGQVVAGYAPRFSRSAASTVEQFRQTDLAGAIAAWS